MKRLTTPAPFRAQFHQTPGRVVTEFAGRPMALLGSAAREDAETRVRGCGRPVRLVGSTTKYDRATGELVGH
jgi:hypothetical protein